MLLQMSGSYGTFDPELRVSPKPVIAVLSALGFVVALGIDARARSMEQWQLALLASLIFVLSAVAWLLDTWNTSIGRWFTIATLVTIDLLWSNWVGMPELLALLVLPIGLAAAMIGLPAAGATALGETALLLLWPSLGGVDRGSPLLGGTLVAIGGTLVVLCAAYRPVFQLSEWMEEYFQRAYRLLNEARDRREELEQAMEDLAHANRQIALSNERLATLRRVAEDAEMTKAAFVAKVSHEFRTPLNMIIGLVSLMVESPSMYAEELPPDLWEDLKIVHRNCEHIASLVNDVLDLTQVEAGRFTLHRERIDLAEIVDGALLVVHPLLEKKGLDLEVDIPDDLPRVYCDGVRIRQVILNLVSNAARFTDEGGIAIGVERQDGQVRVSVTDTGPGIPPEDVKRVFEPFCQGSRLWRDRGGSGLGLSISKQFVQRHGGHIWLDSELGVGTTFSFDLPISPPVEHLASPGRWIKGDWEWRERGFRTEGAGLAEQPLKPRIIICDETGSLYGTLMRYSDEVEFIDAKDMPEAVEALENLPARAVVLNLPAPDDLLPMLAVARRGMASTPIIGCSVSPQASRAYEAGAAGYLIKPVRRADLAHAIRRIDQRVERILVVDDDPEVLRLFTMMLHVLDESLDVVTAGSGERALEQIRDRPPDLVLLDIVMPDIDGWQVLECIRKDDSIDAVPVVFLSGQDPAEQPMASEVLMTTIGGGLSPNQLLSCALELPALLTHPTRSFGSTSA